MPDNLSFTPPNSPPSHEAYQLITQAFISLFDSSEFDVGLLNTYRYIVHRPLTVTQSEFPYKSSGCRKFYHLQVDSYITSNGIFEPPGRISAERAYDIKIPIHLCV